MNTLEYTLRFISDSLLKVRPLETSLLSLDEILTYHAGDEIPISAYTPNLQGKYIRVYLDKFDGSYPETTPKQYYCYGQDVQIVLTAVSRGQEPSQKYPPVLPPKVDLNVPYYDQLNNLEHPQGACNVTCVAMVLKYYGIDSRSAKEISNDVQLEDVLFRKTEKWDKQYGYTGATKTRHIPQFIQRLLREWGAEHGPGKLQNTFFKTVTTETEIKHHLAQGHPVIIHGYFTNSGHLIVIKGYDDEEKVWIAHDPYGKWLGYQGGYADLNLSGADVRYTYADVRTVWDVDGESWCHFPLS
ncbi:C39 family peptidase [Capilliphycus salinus ALCB114379]|uniref:C39 family peptidase n=1 Tax=Capilliphycus salinus TaxID=2768948 RepID=UPI0039A6F37C